MRRATDLIGKSLHQEGKMITHSGILFNLLDPNPDDILIEDIAVHLSRIARWNGATRHFYSVAEHCCRCCDRAAVDDKLACLLHDAEEAYWGDTVSTIKSIIKRDAPHLTDKMRHLRFVIYNKFVAKGNLDEIDRIDKEELMTDFNELILGEWRSCWTPERAESEFLTRFYELKNLGK